MAKHSTLLPQNVLYVTAACLALAGCGLKGDLYLEDPETAKEQQVETDDIAGTENSAEKTSDWTERLELEKEKRAKSGANTTATAAPTAIEQPEILTEQDELRESQEESEQEIGVPALEYANPADDTRDSSTTEAGNSTP